MKIQILAAVLLSSFALSTAYAADDAMPAGNNMTPGATSTAATEPATAEKKAVKT